jgi:predicted ATPase
VRQGPLSYHLKNDPLNETYCDYFCAEGNPLFLEEVAYTVVEQGGSPRSAGVPSTLQAVPGTRIDRLPSEAKRQLQQAAVIGKDVAVPLLEAVAGLPPAALQRGLAHP